MKSHGDTYAKVHGWERSGGRDCGVGGFLWGNDMVSLWIDVLDFDLDMLNSRQTTSAETTGCWHPDLAMHRCPSTWSWR